MNPSWIVAGLLAFAFGMSAWRTGRSASAYRVARLALLTACSILLYLCLLPPSTQEGFVASELVVVAPGATPAQLAALSSASTIVALPDSGQRSDVESVPDLGTALRRHPDARSLRIVGGGLPARDRDAARGHVARFDAAPLPTGVVELSVPSVVRAGSTWRVSGRVEGVPHARVELRDPASTVVATGLVDDGGRFALQAQAKATGNVLFSLRVLDGAGQRVEDISVPLVTSDAQPLRVLLLAGAPDPELKYFRRWASDAGIALDSRVALTEGIALTEGAAALDARALRQADVAILDERSWAALDEARKALLLAAVDEGLGLLLRVTGPIDATVASEWAALGFATRPDDATTPVSLARELGIDGASPRFTRRSIKVDAPTAAPLLRADDGSWLAAWRSRAQGRVALWWLADSWTLATTGEPARFATLWSDTLATVARARGTPTADPVSDARIGERAVLCGLHPGDRVENARGDRVALAIDDASAGACAGFWPTEAGWHAVTSGETRRPFHVRADNEARALARADAARATRALLGALPASSTRTTRATPMPRWPFFIAWLFAIGVLWWLERRAIGRSHSTRSGMTR